MTTNPCIKCGMELLNFTERICDNCRKNKKKAISNREINAKFLKQLERIRISYNRFSNTIQNKSLELSNMRDRYILNEEGEKILNLKLGEITGFKILLIEEWKNLNKKIVDDVEMNESIILNELKNKK